MKNSLLLISPPEQQVLMEAGDRPNIGIGYVASAAQQAGHKVKISDLNHEDYATLHAKIADFKPTFIGMTTTTPYFNWTRNFAQFLRNKYPTTTLIAGGPHATVDPESLEDRFDFIVEGEGEKAIVDILEGDVNGKIIRRPFVKDLYDLPRPARDLFPLDSRYGINQEGQRTATILGSRSCNYACFFCTKDISFLFS